MLHFQVDLIELSNLDVIKSFRKYLNRFATVQGGGRSFSAGNASEANEYGALQTKTSFQEYPLQNVIGFSDYQSNAQYQDFSQATGAGTDGYSTTLSQKVNKVSIFFTTSASFTKLSVFGSVFKKAMLSS